MTNPQQLSYGSADVEKSQKEDLQTSSILNEDGYGQTDYTLGETYYLKDDGKNSEGRLSRALYPLVIAALIIGSLIWFFSLDVDHVPAATDSDIVIDVESDVSSGPMTTEIDHHTERIKMSAYCEDHSACAGLVDYCCPTIGGTFLVCCNIE